MHLKTARVVGRKQPDTARSMTGQVVCALEAKIQIVTLIPQLRKLYLVKRGKTCENVIQLKLQ